MDKPSCTKKGERREGTLFETRKEQSFASALLAIHQIVDLQAPIAIVLLTDGIETLQLGEQLKTGWRLSNSNPHYYWSVLAKPLT